MKIVKIAYHCDYCKRPIDTDSDPVYTLHPGRIGYQDSVVYDAEDGIRHYHRECVGRLLAFTAVKEEPEAGEAEPTTDGENREPENLSEEKEDPEEEARKTSRRKDLPALKAFLDAGRTQKWCAEEFGTTQPTISAWKKEIDNMQESGTWDGFCKEQRRK